jgi:ribosome-associated protein
MPGALEVRPGLVVPEREQQWRFSRSGGPGGQGVNTSDSRATLSFDVERSLTLAAHPVWRRRALERLAGQLVDGVLSVTASEHRAQLANREAAQARLALLLREATAPPPRARRPTRPTRGSQERRIAEKKRRGQTKRLRGAADES